MGRAGMKIGHIRGVLNLSNVSRPRERSQQASRQRAGVSTYSLKQKETDRLTIGTDMKE